MVQKYQLRRNSKEPGETISKIDESQIEGQIVYINQDSSYNTGTLLRTLCEENKASETEENKAPEKEKNKASDKEENNASKK